MRSTPCWSASASVYEVPPGEATTISTKNEFKTQEAVGGFDIIECGSFDEAVQIAAGHPVAEIGTIEVRPLWGK